MNKMPIKSTLTALFAVAAITVLLASPARAQITGRATSGRTRVSGTVNDPAGKPVVDVQVMITNAVSPTKSTKTKTKKNGTFVHPLVDFGKYKITFVKSGYKVMSYQVENRDSISTDFGSYGPVRFGQAQEPRELVLKSSGTCIFTIIMADDADYERQAMAAAEGSEAEGAEGEGLELVRERHPMEAGNELFELKNYAGALGKFKEALELKDMTSDPSLFFAMGRAQYELGMYADASDSFRRVEELEGEPRRGLYYFHALIANHQGRTQEAVDFLEKELSTSSEENPSMLATLGSMYRDMGRVDEAIGTLERVVAADAKNVNALLSLGAMYGERGDQAKAETYFQAAVEAGANSGKDGAVVFFNLGALNYNQGELRTAAEAFQRAISLRPEYAAAHRELGYTYKDLNELVKAREHFQRYLALSPKAKDKDEITFLVGALQPHS